MYVGPAGYLYFDALVDVFGTAQGMAGITRGGSCGHCISHVLKIVYGLFPALIIQRFGVN